ncbi:hypothetical protein Syun_029755 [Stephania yunnanensis]|uniref:Uncharacterized protein n=1 Tax=Stephania yunnanensis TaxID=152371 RepID=A0AAP0HK56_9MAGN
MYSWHPDRVAHAMGHKGVRIMSGHGGDHMDPRYLDSESFPKWTEMITTQLQQIVDALSQMRTRGTLLAVPVVLTDHAI